MNRGSAKFFVGFVCQSPAAGRPKEMKGTRPYFRPFPLLRVCLTGCAKEESSDCGGHRHHWLRLRKDVTQDVNLRVFGQGGVV